MGIRLHWQGALVLAVCSFGAIAHADEPTTAQVTEAAEIQLKNGESMRGSIISVEPGQRVIVIVAGEQSVIPWNDIAKIVGGPKEASPPVAPPAAATPAPAQTPAKGMPLVRIESNWKDIELNRIDGDIGGGMYNHRTDVTPGIISKYVCRAPCNKLVDGRDGHRFFISGAGMYPTPHFRLDDYDGNVTARVHGVSLARFTGGVITLASGGMFVLGGGMFFGMSYVTESEKPSTENPNPQETAQQIRSISLGLLGVGVALGVTGAILLSAGRTQVELIKTSKGQPALVFDRGVFRF